MLPAGRQSIPFLASIINIFVVLFLFAFLVSELWPDIFDVINKAVLVGCGGHVHLTP